MALPTLHNSDKLLRYALGQLSPLENAPIAEHLSGCRACRDFASFVTQFNGSLRHNRLQLLGPSEACPDTSLIVALEEGDLDEPTSAHVRAHLLFCESCIREFYCLRRFSRRNSWDMVEKLRESLIDLGTTYGVGTFRGLVQIITETPALAHRGADHATGTFKVLEVTIAENQYSVELRAAEDGSLSCDIAGFRTPVSDSLKVTIKSETGEELASTTSDEFGNARLTIPDSRLEGEFYVLSLALKDREEHLLIRLPEP